MNQTLIMAICAVSGVFAGFWLSLVVAYMVCEHKRRKAAKWRRQSHGWRKGGAANA